MKQIKRIITDMSSWVAVSVMVAERFKVRKEPFVITLAPCKKSWEQLAYIHAEVLPKLGQALYDAGEINKNTERMTKLWLKVKCGFGEWVEFGTQLVFDARSFESANKEEMSNIIDTAIWEAGERSVYIPPPKEKGC